MERKIVDKLTKWKTSGNRMLLTSFDEFLYIIKLYLLFLSENRI